MALKAEQAHDSELQRLREAMARAEGAPSLDEVEALNYQLQIAFIGAVRAGKIKSVRRYAVAQHQVSQYEARQMLKRVIAPQPVESMRRVDELAREMGVSADRKPFSVTLAHGLGKTRAQFSGVLAGDEPDAISLAKGHMRLPNVWDVRAVRGAAS